VLVADPRRYWNEQASTFDQEPDHGLRDPRTRSAWSALLAEHLPPVPARIADVGCGTGTLSVLLAQTGYRVSGLDFSPDMIERARIKANAARVEVELVVGDAAAPPWASGMFDCVLSRHVLWALPDPTRGVERWLSLLRPKGRLVLIEGRWSTGAGIPSTTAVPLLEQQHRRATVIELLDPTLWGGPITDERYLVVSDASESP